MKIKVLKPFVSGRISGEAGSTVDVTMSKAEKLIAIGVAENVDEGDKSLGEKKTTAKSAQSSGKTTGKK